MKNKNPVGVARFPKTCFNHLENLARNQEISTAAIIPITMTNPLTAGDWMMSFIHSPMFLMNSHGFGMSKITKHLAISIIS